MAGAKKQFCKHGHDTFVCGRNKANGQCNQCIKEHQQTKEYKIYQNKYSKKYEKSPKRKKYLASTKEQRRIYKHEYYENNKEKLVALTKKWAKEHPDLVKKIKENWRQKHKEQRNAAVRKLNKDPNHKLMQLLRSRINAALKGKMKPASAVKMLGCSIDELRTHIESLFLPGMTWDNHGKGKYKWHIDHILPLDSFDLTDSEQFAEACHYTNLQPLWEPDNLKKSNKILVRKR